MKPTKLDITVENNLGGEKIIMGLDKSALTHIAGVLTDLYSDPKLAVMREYSTNAWDSHVEAGQTRPIEITTPTVFAPFLTIRDYGTGMNREDIESTYSLYGASSKRNTDAQSGVLGLGCKSALTYTSQFNVIGIKNSTRTVVSVSRDEDGIGSMTIVEAGPTDASDGVEIIIPTKRGDLFLAEADKLFPYWKPGTVLVNGVKPAHYKGLEISPAITLTTPSTFNSPSIIVMGNVPYPIPVEWSPLGPSPGWRSLICEVGIGEVQFAPSREALQLTKRTKERLEKLKQEYDENCFAAAEKDINKCASASEALVRYQEWQEMLATTKSLNLKYNGKDIPNSIVHDNGITTTQKSSYKLSANNIGTSISISGLKKTLFVYGFDVKFNANHKKKLNAYCVEKKLDVNIFALSKDKVATGWIRPSHEVHFDIIKDAGSFNSGARYNKKNIPGSYEVYTALGYTKEAKAINSQEPILYFSTKERANDIVRAVKQFSSNASIVRLPANRKEKFARDFPMARDAFAFINEEINKYLTNLKDDDIGAALLRKKYEIRIVRQLDPSKIKDPRVKHIIQLAKMPKNDHLDAMMAIIDALCVRVDRFENHKAFDIRKEYPLISNHIGNISKEPHTYIYMNAVYDN